MSGAQRDDGFAVELDDQPQDAVCRRVLRSHVEDHQSGWRQGRCHGGGGARRSGRTSSTPGLIWSSVFVRFGCVRNQGGGVAEAGKCGAMVACPELFPATSTNAMAYLYPSTG